MNAELIFWIHCNSYLVSEGEIHHHFNIHRSVHCNSYLVSEGEIHHHFNVHGSVHCKNILIYVQQDATLHSLFYLETALRVSGGTTTQNM